MQSIESLRLTIRRRAFGNLLLIVRDAAARSAGRFEVEGLEDALALRFYDVRTLVRQMDGFAEASRDFTVLVVAPPLWPFDREAPLVPIVVTPPDFRHPNSDSHQVCVDMRGIAPERVPELVYDNLRVKNRRLDHMVDRAAADFVRTHMASRPADPRPLYPSADEDA